MPQREASETFATNTTELVSVVGTSVSTNTSVIDVRILTAWRHAFLLIRSNVPLSVSLNLEAEGPAHSRNYSLLLALKFACKVIPLGQPFLQRMIQLTRNVLLPHHRIKLSHVFFKDLRSWEDFICNWNGAGFFMPSYWDASDVLSLYTDSSSSLGFGGIFQTHWFQGSWKPHQKLGQLGISIAWQELSAFVVACHLWAKCF